MNWEEEGLEQMGRRREEEEGHEMRRFVFGGQC